MADGLMVLSSIRKLLSRSVLGSSLAGDGLLVRLRSTSIALIGVVAAVGLGLVAFISQLGWPAVLNAPIPGSPAEAGTVRDAIALTQPSRSGTPAVPGLAPGVPARATQVTRDHQEPSGVGGSAVGGSHQLGGTAQPPAPASNTPSAPTSTPTPEPEPSPVTAVTTTPTTAATAQPVTSPSVPTKPDTSVVSPSTPTSPAEHDEDEHEKPGEGEHGTSDGDNSAKPGQDGHGSSSGELPEPTEVTSPAEAHPESVGHGAEGSDRSDWHRH